MYVYVCTCLYRASSQENPDDQNVVIFFYAVFAKSSFGTELKKKEAFMTEKYKIILLSKNREILHGLKKKNNYGGGKNTVLPRIRTMPKCAIDRVNCVSLWTLRDKKPRRRAVGKFGFFFFFFR